MAGQTITADMCGKMVEAATRSCQPMISVPPEQANPNWDAMAVALTAQSNAIAWGSIILAVIFFVAGLAWSRVVLATAKQEAREAADREAKAMAKSCADDYIGKWLAEQAPGIIRERVDFILDATLGSDDDATAADDLGEQAG